MPSGYLSSGSLLADGRKLLCLGLYVHQSDSLHGLSKLTRKLLLLRLLHSRHRE